MRLRSQGHETYIVGGTVRDILLGCTAKDVDILTSAEPQQVAPLFPRSFVVGRSFPICQVHVKGEVVEVSSFSTSADPSKIPLDAAASCSGRDSQRRESSRALRRRLEGKTKGKKGRILRKDDDDDDVDGDGEAQQLAVADLADSLGLATTTTTTALILSSHTNGNRIVGVGRPSGPTWADARRENSIKRDFTVNALLYDPFSRILFDYAGGVADCATRTLRTIDDPVASFAQDPARILRGVRLAARAGLVIEESTADAMSAMVPLTSSLPYGRLQMEMAAMVTHGAAKMSVQLLWRFGLLEMLLPHIAVMLTVRKMYIRKFHF